MQGRFRKFTTQTNLDLSKLKSDYNAFNELLKPIAIKRVSGTAGNTQVKDYIVNKMKSYGWLVETPSFSSYTPYGNKNFVNIIANYPVGTTYSRNNQQDANSKAYLGKRIVFACHYDSKYFENFDFIGAVDSAVPCALLLDMAKYLKDNYNTNNLKKVSNLNSNQIIFISNFYFNLS